MCFKGKEHVYTLYLSKMSSYTNKYKKLTELIKTEHKAFAWFGKEG